MNFKQQAAPVDPELEREKAAARADKIGAIRDQVGDFTEQLIRAFGAKLSLRGGAGGGTSSAAASQPAAGKPNFLGLTLPPILGGF